MGFKSTITSEVPVANMMRIMPPTMMRYQPKALKPYFERKLTNHFMASMATMKATTHPRMSIVMLWVVAQSASSFMRSRRSRSVAPAMVGTARKNENSAARRRVSFCAMPPTIVAMERLMPGMTERHWNIPIQKARRAVSLLSSEPLLKIWSQKSMKMPPKTRVMATTHTLSRSQSKRPLFLAARPTTTAGRTPTMRSI